MIATRLQSNVQCNQNQQIYSVYDSKSGKPIPKAKILLYKPNYPGYTLLDSLFTNSRGMAFSFRSLSKQNLAYQVINPENPQQHKDTHTNPGIQRKSKMTHIDHHHTQQDR
jgi:hypothetical protein